MDKRVNVAFFSGVQLITHPEDSLCVCVGWYIAWTLEKVTILQKWKWQYKYKYDIIVNCVYGLLCALNSWNAKNDWHNDHKN